ncbi:MULTISPECIES: hypothetical protein [Bacillati]|uniref:hypothetical protein n=1 Tax=Bacillati TaxID=1783272 RepID=UPI0034395033
MIPQTIRPVGPRAVRPYLAQTQPDALRRALAVSAQAVGAVRSALPYDVSQLRRDGGYCVTIQYSESRQAVTEFAQAHGAEVSVAPIESRAGWSAIDARTHINGVPVHAWTEIPTPVEGAETIGADR